MSTSQTELKGKDLEVWKKFIGGLTDEDMNEEEYCGIMELRLKIKNEKFGVLYSKIKKAMYSFWNDNRDIQKAMIDKKDHSHSNRICNYIDSFIFDKNNEFGFLHPLVEIGAEDLFVLLCSIQLHDYGKGRWQLVYYSLIHDAIELYQKNDIPIDAKKLNNFYEKISVESLFDDIQNDIGRDVAESIEATLLKNTSTAKALKSLITAEQLSPEGASIVENYHTQNIRLFLDAIIDRDKNGYKYEFIKEKIFDIVPDVETNILCSLLEEIPAHLLKKIKIITSAHKDFKPFINKNDLISFFPESDIDVGWLCALLKLGDSLDMDQKRVIGKGQRDLTGILNKLLETEDKFRIDDNLANTFAIWIKFLLVKNVDITHKRDSSIIDITINYYSFPDQKEYFYTLRKLTENDFFDLTFLQEIPRKIKDMKDEDVKINLIYTIANEKNPEYKELKIIDAVKEWFDEKRKKNEQSLDKMKCCSLKSDKYKSFLQFIPLKGFNGKDELLLPQSRDYYTLLRLVNDNIISLSRINRHLNKIVSEEEIVGSEFIVKKDAEGPPSFVFSMARRQRKNLKRFFKIADKNIKTIKKKIDELENFGRIFPFSEYEGEDGLTSGIVGLDEILSNSLNKSSGIKHSRNILIKGGPGSGKTTMAFQFLAQCKKNGMKVLYLSFEEKQSRLEDEFKRNFGWSVNVRSFPSFKEFLGGMCQCQEGSPKQLLDNFEDEIRSYNIDVLAIDSLNRFRDYFENTENFERFIREFFTYTYSRNITALYILEEDEEKFAEYASDGIIHLENIKGNRKIKIKKLRNQPYTQGNHNFCIIDKNYLHDKSANSIEKYWLDIGINVFPNTRIYLNDFRNDVVFREQSKYESIKSGIEGLDKMLPGSSAIEKDGFIKGNIILIIGSPGSGKTITGLHFLKQGISVPKQKGKQLKEKGLWITFEGSKQDLYNTICRFDSSVGFSGLFDNNNDFLFHFFSPAYFKPDELIFAIRKIVERQPGITRLVIDSISEIEELFAKANNFKNFMAVFMQQLRQMGLTTVFLYRSTEFFGFQKQTKTSISSLVDTIISFKTFDIKNRIKKGLFILKSRGREQKSELQTMEILSDEGIVVSNKGWELEGLLSGETGEIKEPYIFLKLFFENPAEDKINEYLIKDFRSRYPADNRIFTSVRKPQIYSEFWSFKGNYGAGHANIRIVSLCKYMVEAFRENDRLHILNGYFSTSLLSDIESEPRWNTYKNKDGKFDFLPSYNDFGMLVFQRHLYDKLEDDSSDQSTDGKKNKIRIEEDVTWEERIDQASTICELLNNKDPKKPTIHPFALPPLDNASEFIAFFMEILWSYDGDIFHLPPVESKKDDSQPYENKLSYYKKLILYNRALQGQIKSLIDDDSPLIKGEGEKNRIKSNLKKFQENSKDKSKFQNDVSDVIRISDREAKEALGFLYDLVHKYKCPNPIKGDYRAKALFSRKWYSEIQEMRRHISSIQGGVEDQYDLSKIGASKLDISQNIDSIEPTHKLNLQNMRSLNIELAGNYYTISRSKKPLEASLCSGSIDLEVFRLPYVENSRKSCTTQAVWCLSIIRDALSPEIGWIFIDSMVSNDIARMRSMEKLGLPVKIDHVKSETYNRYDRSVYKKVARIMETDSKLEDLSQMVSQKRAEGLSSEEFNKFYEECKNIGIYSKPELELLKKDILPTIDELPEEKSNEQPNPKSNSLPLVIEAPDEILYCSKLRANRPYFYRFEKILHGNIKKLFSPDDDSKNESREEAINKTLKNVKNQLIIEIFKNPGV